MGRARVGMRSRRLPSLSLLGRPREAYDRLTGYADLLLDRLFAGTPNYETVSRETALRDAQAHLGDAADVLGEPALARVEEATRRLLADIRGEDPFRLRWAADSVLARWCYLVCRLLEPSVVVETGVAYGVSSAFILSALEQNGRGTLHSVDLPPTSRGADGFWGIAVPGELRERWHLHRGASKRVLPRLLRKTGPLDLFVHDSLHTRRNMRREFETVWPYLGDGGVILADDVERNGAFGELRRRGPALWRVVEDREEAPLHGRAAPVVFGVAIK